MIILGRVQFVVIDEHVIARIVNEKETILRPSK